MFWSTEKPSTKTYHTPTNGKRIFEPVVYTDNIHSNLKYKKMCVRGHEIDIKKRLNKYNLNQGEKTALAQAMSYYVSNQKKNHFIISKGVGKFTKDCPSNVSCSSHEGDAMYLFQSFSNDEELMYNFDKGSENFLDSNDSPKFQLVEDVPVGMDYHRSPILSKIHVRSSHHLKYVSNKPLKELNQVRNKLKIRRPLQEMNQIQEKSRK